MCMLQKDFKSLTIFPLRLQDLIQELRSETSGNFRECIVALMEPKVPLCFNFHPSSFISSSPLPSFLLFPSLSPSSFSSLCFLFLFFTDFSSLPHRFSMMPKLCTVLSVKKEQIYSASLKSCAPVLTRRLQRSGRLTRIVSLDS